MSSAGTVLIHEILAKHGARKDVRLWRNTIGDGWHGKLVAKPDAPRTFRLIPGDVVLRGARYVTFGLPAGSGDLIGAYSVPVASLDPSAHVAIFTSAEIKAEGDRMRPGQRGWLEFVREFGGIAFVAKCLEDVTAVLGAP